MAAFSSPLSAQEDRIVRPEEHREFLEKAREGELVRPAPAREQRLMLAQIREDFRRLQSINAERIQPSITGNVIDYSKIVKASANIERRAVRLKNNLALPDTNDTPTEPENTLSYLDQLKRLDSAICSFVSNPIFQTAKVIDVQLAEKATRDLDEIITISRLLKRNRNRRFSGRYVQTDRFYSAFSTRSHTSSDLGPAAQHAAVIPLVILHFPR